MGSTSVELKIQSTPMRKHDLPGNRVDILRLHSIGSNAVEE